MGWKRTFRRRYPGYSEFVYSLKTVTYYLQQVGALVGHLAPGPQPEAVTEIAQRGMALVSTIAAIHQNATDIMTGVNRVGIRNEHRAMAAALRQSLRHIDGIEGNAIALGFVTARDDNAYTEVQHILRHITYAGQAIESTLAMLEKMEGLP